MAKKPVKKAAAKKAAPAKKTTATKTAVVAKTTAITRVPKVKVAAKPKSATGAYTQSEFIESVRAFCGLVKRTEAKEMCEDLANLFKDTLKKGYKVPFFGLGKMFVRQSKARMGRNPQTGATIKIPARKRLRFTPTKALKDAVL